MRTSARPAACRATMCRAMCSASSSTRNASPITTSSIASSNSSGNRDMWTPFCAGSRSTVQSISAEISFSPPPQRSRIAFATPCTPARDRPSRTSDVDACRSSRRSRDSRMSDRLVSVSAVGHTDTTFPRLVSLAAHDLRTPLATIHGFAQTILRTGNLGEPNQRYVEMIDAASRQLAELLDELGVAARIEGGRYEPTLRTADTLALAALRHGGLEQLDLRVDGSVLAISPVTPASGPVLVGDDLRDLGAAVAVRVVRAGGGSVDLDGDVLKVLLPE